MEKVSFPRFVQMLSTSYSLASEDHNYRYKVGHNCPILHSSSPNYSESSIPFQFFALWPSVWDLVQFSLPCPFSYKISNFVGSGRPICPYIAPLLQDIPFARRGEFLTFLLEKF